MMLELMVLFYHTMPALCVVVCVRVLRVCVCLVCVCLVCLVCVRE